MVKNEEIKRINDNTMLKKYKELTGIMAEVCLNYYRLKQKEQLPPGQTTRFSRFSARLKHLPYRLKMRLKRGL